MSDKWVELELDSKEPEIEIEKPETKQETVAETPEQTPPEAEGIKNPKINQRIQALVKRRNEAEARMQQMAEALAKKDAEMAELRKTAVSTQTQNVDIYGKSLENQLNLAKKAFKDAYEKGDADGLTDAQEQIADLKAKMTNLVSYKQQLEATEKAMPTVEEKKKEEGPRMPQAARDWISDNDWFNKDQKMTRRALLVNQELLDEGYDPNSDDFYNELDNRLQSFGVKKKEVEVEETVEEDKPRKRQSPVSGNTRETASTGSSKKIRLSEADVATAKKLGVTPEDFARQKLRIKKAQDANEAYTPIFD